MAAPRPLGTILERMLIVAAAGETDARVAELFGITEEEARLMLWGLRPLRLRPPSVPARRGDGVRR